jgi:hypothetical protein
MVTSSGSTLDTSSSSHDHTNRVIFSQLVQAHPTSAHFVDLSISVAIGGALQNHLPFPRPGTRREHEACIWQTKYQGVRVDTVSSL